MNHASNLIVLFSAAFVQVNAVDYYVIPFNSPSAGLGGCRADRYLENLATKAECVEATGALHANGNSVQDKSARGWPKGCFRNGNNLWFNTAANGQTVKEFTRGIVACEDDSFVVDATCTAQKDNGKAACEGVTAANGNACVFIRNTIDITCKNDAGVNVATCTAEKENGQAACEGATTANTCKDDANAVDATCTAEKNNGQAACEAATAANTRACVWADGNACVYDNKPPNGGWGKDGTVLAFCKKKTDGCNTRYPFRRSGTAFCFTTKAHADLSTDPGCQYWCCRAGEVCQCGATSSSDPSTFTGNICTSTSNKYATLFDKANLANPCQSSARSTGANAMASIFTSTDTDDAMNANCLAAANELLFNPARTADPESAGDSWPNGCFFQPASKVPTLRMAKQERVGAGIPLGPFLCDIDECTRNTDNCDNTNAACTNTVGSFTCACNSGFSGNGVTCSENQCLAVTTTAATTTAGIASACPGGGATGSRTCTFECASGYSLVGSTTITCGMDGNWPTAPTCAENQCSAITTAAAATTTAGIMSACPGGGATGSPTCTFECESGYSIAGGSGSTTITCGMDGNWPITPTCAENQCSAITTTAATTTAGVASACPGGGATGSPTCTFECASGYSLVGAATITCGMDGNWPSAPMCLGNACASDFTTANIASAGGVTTVSGSTFMFACKTDFKASSVATCTNGAWDKPKCVAEKPATPVDPDSVDADDVVVIVHSLTFSGVATSKVCTKDGKLAIIRALAEDLSVKADYIKITKCIKASAARRSRRLVNKARMLNFEGVIVEYEVSLPKEESTTEKQSAIITRMEAISDTGSASSTKVISAVATEAGTSVNEVAVTESTTKVKVKSVKSVVTAKSSGIAGISPMNVMFIVAAFFVACALAYVCNHKSKNGTQQQKKVKELSSVEMASNPK